MSLMTVPGLMTPGQRTMQGTGNPPSQFIFFSPRKGARLLAPYSRWSDRVLIVMLAESIYAQVASPRRDSPAHGNGNMATVAICPHGKRPRALLDCACARRNYLGSWGIVERQLRRHAS